MWIEKEKKKKKKKKKKPRERSQLLFTLSIQTNLFLNVA